MTSMCVPFVLLSFGAAVVACTGGSSGKGDGPLTMRVLSGSGVEGDSCSLGGGSDVQGDCASGFWCNSNNGTCQSARLPEGSPIPGVMMGCDPSAAALACESFVCNPMMNACGAVNNPGGGTSTGGTSGGDSAGGGTSTGGTSGGDSTGGGTSTGGTSGGDSTGGGTGDGGGLDDAGEPDAGAGSDAGSDADTPDGGDVEPDAGGGAPDSGANPDAGTPSTPKMVDLAVTASFSSHYPLGGKIRGSLTVSNRGPAAVPATLTIRVDSLTGPTITVAGEGVDCSSDGAVPATNSSASTCSIPSVPLGTSLRLDVTAATQDEYTNEGTIAAQITPTGVEERTPADNTSTARITLFHSYSSVPSTSRNNTFSCAAQAGRAGATNAAPWLGALLALLVCKVRRRRS